MAKTSDKKTASAQHKLIPVRRDYHWTKMELDELPAKLAAEKKAKLDNLARKYNAALSKSAYAACDKDAYATDALEQKMQKFDVKQYPSYRRVNHACAKQIFKALKAGEDWKPALEKLDADIDVLKRKRSAYRAVQEKKKDAFLAKNNTSDDTEYQKQKVQLKAQYDAEEQKINDAYAQKLSAEEAKLNAKLAKYDQKMQSVKAGIDNSLSLPDDVLLRIEGLKMYFGGLKAVDDLTFDVKKGEIFGLIGPNGAGKTTVFNCITRFYNATAGNLYFTNNQNEVVNLRNFKVHDVIVQGISRTFQNVELVREISVLDNLMMACTRDFRSNLLVQLLGLPSLHKEEAAIRQKAMNILKFMGLDSYAAWYAMGLPYGVLKKVEIARALMADAKLIIMDEPAAGLNDSETAELTRLIRRIRDEFNVTILLVEHDMGLVMNVCDTVCCISFGKMLAIGTCEEIKSNKAVQEAYLGVEDDA